MSVPALLSASGPVHVSIEMDAGETRVSADPLRKHIGRRLAAAGIATVDDDNLQGAAQRLPAELTVTVSIRWASGVPEAPGLYLVSLVATHAQRAALVRSAALAGMATSWQEPWVFAAHDGDDLNAQTSQAADGLVDDFVRDYQAANPPKPAAP